MIPVFVGLFRQPTEVELPTVGLDAEAQGRKGQVEDADQAAAAVDHPVLAHERRQLGRAEARLDQPLEPRAPDGRLGPGRLEEAPAARRYPPDRDGAAALPSPGSSAS